MNWPGNRRSNRDQLARDIAFEPFRAHLKQVVTIHRIMFDKLLFQQQGVPHELGQLFADAGKTYLEIAKELGRYHDASDSMLNNILKPES